VPNLAGHAGFHLFAVCDGHGTNGHHVSAEIKAELPKQMQQRLLADNDFVALQDTPSLRERITQYFEEAFQNVHEGLWKKSFDVQLSGSTCTVVMFDSTRVYCANAGDSRAVLFSMTQNHLKPTALSDDHKPSSETEKSRILRSGGRIEPIRGQQGQPLGPERVWA
jgi:serine/threonine protein phosphatase PrpC